ncbi:MAG: hypothetical protein SFU85_05035 [Candidatus Methylacidiphilales bacterium]|nr:hypothetical protein [Candidatus Methylacidiphilales bacterium]
MKRFLLVLAASVIVVAGLSGCASTESQDSTKEGRSKYSTVPWNKPQSWEGKGVLGGVVQ